MSLDRATDAPYILQREGKPDITILKIKLRDIGELVSKYRACELKRFKDLLSGESLKTDEKVKAIALLHSVPDCSMSHLWDWSQTMLGSIEVTAMALTKAGEKDASEIIDTLDSEKLQVIAAEVLGHPWAPSKRAKVEETKDKEAPNPNG